MKTHLFFLCLLPACLYMCSCSPKLAPVGHYQDTPVVADGKIDDWQLPLRFSNEKHTFQYNVTNDNRFIYICIASSDNVTERRMLKDGMTIYFDPKGKKRMDMAILFPIKNTGENNNRVGNFRNRNGNAFRPANEDSIKNTLLLQDNYFETKGFSGIENGQFSIFDKKNGIHVAIKTDNDSALVYEAVLPINLITGADYLPAKENFDIGIKLNAGTVQTGYANQSPRASFGGGGLRMGGRMGGMLGGGRAGRGSQAAQTTKEEYTWYEFQLAGESGKK